MYFSGYITFYLELSGPSWIANELYPTLETSYVIEWRTFFKSSNRENFILSHLPLIYKESEIDQVILNKIFSIQKTSLIFS